MALWSRVGVVGASGSLGGCCVCVFHCTTKLDVVVAVFHCTMKLAMGDMFTLSPCFVMLINLFALFQFSVLL